MAETVRAEITKSTADFLAKYLPEDKLKILLSKQVPRQFLNNFFDLPQIRKTYMYLPMPKLREISKSDDSMDDIAVVNKINDDFYTYSEAMLDIIINLNEDDRKQFIIMMPYDVLVDVITSNSETTLKYMQDELLSLDDETLATYQKEGFYYYVNAASDMWFGVR
jgi:hypothetical protein